jgi:hypothetical protein
MPISGDMLPSHGTHVELTAGGEPLGGVRVVTSAPSSPAGCFTLSMPPAQAPAAGATVTLRWPAGMRGRYALAVTVVEVEESRVQVSPAGPVEIEQHRNFVRGGGGEQVLLCRPGHGDVLGWIRDISEQGVRAHFADVTVNAGDEIRLRVQLDEEIIEVPAVATKVGSLRQSLPQRGPTSVELVAALTPGESQAQTIRRYVFRQQLLARSRAAN